MGTIYKPPEKKESPIEVLCRRLAEATARYAALEEQTKEAKRELAALQYEAAETFAKVGVQNIKTRSGVTCYLRSDRFVSKQKDTPTEDIIQALRQHELGDMVSETYAANTFKAWVLERHNELREERPDAELEEAIPEDMRDMFSTFELWRVVALGAK